MDINVYNHTIAIDQCEHNTLKYTASLSKLDIPNKLYTLQDMTAMGDSVAQNSPAHTLNIVILIQNDRGIKDSWLLVPCPGYHD